MTLATRTLVICLFLVGCADKGSTDTGTSSTTPETETATTETETTTTSSGTTTSTTTTTGTTTTSTTTTTTTTTVGTTTTTTGVGFVDVAGTWLGNYLSTPTGTAGTINATLTQVVDVVSGSMTLQGSPCFTVLSIAGTATPTGFDLNATDVNTNLRLLGTLNGNTVTGDYQVIQGGACTGDFGTFTINR